MEENETFVRAAHLILVGGFRPKGVRGSIPAIAIGLVAVISTFLSNWFSKEEGETPMKKKAMSMRVVCSSVFETISAIGTIAVGDALLT